MIRKKYIVVIFCIIILVLALLVDIFFPDLFNVYPSTFSEQLKRITIEDYLNKYKTEKEISRNKAFLEIEDILANYKGDELKFDIQPIEITKVVSSDNVLLKCTIIALIDLKSDSKVIIIPKSTFLIQAIPLDKEIQFKLAGPHCDIWEEEPTILFMGRGRIAVSKETAEKNKIDLSTYEEDFIEDNYYSTLDITGEYVFSDHLSFK
ncbi:hypothetical protein [Sinanaerobacter sp. ZZT-01]|uniref:hypothetical protein n=1 Tax=Sinanaerobacter sp. ZZT-01 TaxID=3111540 RepID=UPI002D792E9B|nr:hypothetical protein [Sinanaerobacter sp. ZZT-01]WRR93274.1 hypothetical protein U5921_14775 [Sinanaerobacter sp. ZZT-01]